MQKGSEAIFAPVPMCRGKQEYATRHFHANAAWLTPWAMARNLLRATGALASAFRTKATTATPRAHLVRVPAQIARSARRMILRLPQRWHWQHAWTQLFCTVHAPPGPARGH
ncbi:hypothetical protein [Streptomyces sp. NPDC048737]|uniref:hypothetical protein n=1 Tax=unclassified Streptomyces TaxID=2593676 RepID=UPI003444A6E9